MMFVGSNNQKSRPGFHFGFQRGIADEHLLCSQLLARSIGVLGA